GPSDSGYAKVATASAPTASGTFSYTAGKGDGSYSFYTVATDKAGNVEAAPSSADTTTQSDTAAPTSSASSPQYAGSGGVTVTYTARESGVWGATVDLCAKGPGA